MSSTSSAWSIVALSSTDPQRRAADRVLIGVAVTSAELDSDVADLKNHGGVDAGASSVGQSLVRFAEEAPACSSTSSNDSTDR
jgi:hypothetical protein